MDMMDIQMDIQRVRSTDEGGGWGCEGDAVVLAAKGGKRGLGGLKSMQPANRARKLGIAGKGMWRSVRSDHLFVLIVRGGGGGRTDQKLPVAAQQEV